MILFKQIMLYTIKQQEDNFYHQAIEEQLEPLISACILLEDYVQKKNRVSPTSYISLGIGGVRVCVPVLSLYDIVGFTVTELMERDTFDEYVHLNCVMMN